MLSRTTFIFPLVLLSLLQIAEAACPRKLFNGLRELTYGRNGAAARELAQKLADLERAKEKALKPILEHISNAYTKGQELTKLKYEMMDLKKIPNPDKVQLDRMAEIELKYAETTKDITDINNKYLTEMHATYKREGIPSILVTRDDGAMVLKLDFSSGPTKKSAYEFYRKVQSRFGIKEVTLSLKDNSEAGFAGFFSPHLERIDMGPGQGFSMLEDYFNSVSKHESRHSMFFHKRMIGDDSIFHTQFYASPNGNLLNADKAYDTYMSSEEIYTYSTDLQSLAQAFSRDIIVDVAQKKQLLEQISSHNQTFKVVVKASQNVTQEMISSLDELAKSSAPSEGMFVQKSETGQIAINFGDKLNRRTEIIMVSDAEKKLAQNMLDTQAKRGQFVDQYVSEALKKASVNVDELSLRIKANKVTAEEMAILQKYMLEALSSPQGQQLTADLNQAVKPLISNARENMIALNKLSEIQGKEATKINEMLKKMAELKDKVTDADIGILKKQMFSTAKKVKEDYRGFALAPEAPVTP